MKETTNQLKVLEESTARLSNALRSGSASSRRKRKAWVDCTTQYKNHQKKKIKEDVKDALSFTETENFKPVRVEVVNKSTKEVINVDCSGTDNVMGNVTSSIEKTLYVKERFNVSDVAYHELAQLNPALPHQSELAKNLNAQCQILPTPGQTVGVQQSIVERLSIRLRYILKASPSLPQGNLFA